MSLVGGRHGTAIRYGNRDGCRGDVPVNEWCIGSANMDGASCIKDHIGFGGGGGLRVVVAIEVDT